VASSAAWAGCAAAVPPTIAPTAVVPEYSSSDQLTIKFSVAASEAPEEANAITPTDLADALNEFIASRGRPSITFYGTPAPAPLN
jgi:hypothetical protein